MAYLVLICIPLLLILLISDVVAPSLAFFSMAFIFQLLGIISLESFLTSYVNPTLISLILLLLISTAIERTSVINYAARHLITRNESHSLIRLIGFSSLLSAFINNTAVVSAFISTVARQHRLNPSRLLIPLSYASIIGGITTLIGTSTNLIVNSFVIKAGHAPIGLFAFAAVGLPIAFICLPLLFFLSKRLTERAPNRLPVDKTYFLNALVEKNCPLIGKSVRDNQLHDLNGMFLLEIERAGRLISPVSPTEIIQANDNLIFTGAAEHLSDLRKHHHLRILGEKIDDLLTGNLTEVIVLPNACIINQTLQTLDFRSMFNAGIVAIHRRGKRLTGNLGNIQIKTGDNLILATSADFYDQTNIERNFAILNEKAIRKTLSPKRSTFVIIGFLAAIFSAAIGLIPLINALILLLGALIISKTLEIQDLKSCFPFDLLIIIGSSLALSEALINSGAADIIGETMQHLFSKMGIYGALIAIYFLTVLLTEAITNNAAAAIVVPIAISTANAYQVDIMPFVMIVAYAASACFLMPFGYQTHLMVYSPGNYKIIDFIRTGFPLTLIYGAIAIILVPVFFPF
ncbi:SLC13 family permease [Suttonella ornithocola]|uniref:Na(+)/dicarboxylate symporter n=1 Tax=Suttonella ornithocola TaxID=279832 RepID=A0A380MM17_9GAMM|nr:SLC13 family permease [Suttonella ornithocola]SUO93352.1 Na(+)/dicarboxylate symporter [Suttonella ornithocola]